jgi:ABC-type transporter Mla maintaining outer membrane lipid asymmetry ATPase subunit MlaF
LIVLAEGRVLADGPVDQVTRIDHPWIRSYFSIRTMVGAEDTPAHGS